MIVRESIPLAEIIGIAEAQFGDLVKAVVDVRRGILSLGAELHADDEAALINVRPSQGNRSRDVESSETRAELRRIVERLVIR